MALEPNQKTVRIEYPFDLPEENCAGSSIFVPWVIERHLVKKLGVTSDDTVVLVKEDREMKAKIAPQPTEELLVVADTLN